MGWYKYFLSHCLGIYLRGCYVPDYNIHPRIAFIL